MSEEHDTETPAEPPGGVYLGSGDILAFRSEVTGHTHGQHSDGLVKSGWLACSECAGAGGRFELGWARASYVDGRYYGPGPGPGPDGDRERERTPSTTSAPNRYQSRRVAGKGAGRG